VINIFYVYTVNLVDSEPAAAGLTIDIFESMGWLRLVGSIKL